MPNLVKRLLAVLIPMRVTDASVMIKQIIAAADSVRTPFEGSGIDNLGWARLDMSTAVSDRHCILNRYPATSLVTHTCSPTQRTAVVILRIPCGHQPANPASP